MASRALVLDANILIRAVLGNRVRRILEKYADSVSFFIPEYAYAEAEGHLATLITKRGGDPANGLIMLRAVVALADLVTTDLYGDYEAEAARHSRSGRLAYSGVRSCTGLPDLDRGYRLLRMWRCHVGGCKKDCVNAVLRE
jgi:hypothetical protein